MVLTNKPAASVIPSRHSWTRRSLACGVVAGPLFVGLVFIQLAIRDGFDLNRHPISLLSLGDSGWIQIANFVVAGALIVACAVGLREVLRSGPGGHWGPRLVGALGAGLMLGGVFVTDAGAGFPPGAPDGAPEHISWHGLLHSVGAILGFSGTAACFVLARGFRALGLRTWARVCLIAGLAVLGVMSWPDLDSLSVRLFIATTIQLVVVSLVAARLMGGLSAGGGLPLVAETRRQAGPDTSRILWRQDRFRLLRWPQQPR